MKPNKLSNNALERTVEHRGPRLAAVRSSQPAAQLGRQAAVKESVEEVASWLEGLSPPRRARFFSLLSHQLTVGMRVLAYDAQSIPSMVESMRALNEVHHRVAGYLVHVLANDENTSWLKPVAGYLVLCPDARAKELIEHAWHHAEGVVEAAA